MDDVNDSPALEVLARRLGEALRARGWQLATAESCTGGWVAKVMTDVAGSSAWFERGFITYSNDAKRELLGVSDDALERYGAVSERVVAEMVSGALARSRADVAVAVSGIAGPGGGTVDKPVGTVWFAWGFPGEGPTARCLCFDGDREAVREQAVRAALLGLLGGLGADG
ncbi:competence damage-inducible protein A [Marichromatium purpuratum 984]|uniref:Competence damage-inducible protein A n=1 Tax=Marichromatium purpuratum 984 TaxID=765910 RepID=W0E5Y8_MARPU|nr:nicotinamide-nucleotide amidase [Marichromatium purpuratum]AHF04963.1 competence damage-inducible protein A [Marichromatium purpuratum 984]